MNKKKILSALISVAMAFGCMAFMPQTELFEPLTDEAVSYSDDIAYGNYLYYQKGDENEDGTYDYVEIIDCKTTTVSIEIPVEIDGLSVTSIGDYAFADCDSLASVTLPDSVTNIGSVM